MIRGHSGRDAWLLVIAVGTALASGCALGPRWGPDATAMNVRRPSDDEWFGIYLGTRKVGTYHSAVKVEERQGSPVLVRRTDTTIAAAVGDGVASETRSEEKAYEARPGGRLLSFSYAERTAAGARKTVDGRCSAEDCTASVVTGNRREQRTLPRVGETAEMADPERLCAARRTDVEGRRLALDSLGTFHARLRWLGMDVVHNGQARVEARVVEEVIGAGRAAVRYAFAVDGRLLEARFGEVVFRAEPRMEALALPGGYARLGELSRVPLPSELPRTVPARVTLRVRGVPAALQLVDARQSWVPQADGTALVTVSARTPIAVGQGRDTPRDGGVEPADAPFLAATLAVDSDTPAIRRTAREIVGERAGSYEASVAILRRLSETIAVATAQSTTRASELLERRRGTSAERANLFAALARAAGVPARIVHGLVYQRFDDGVPAMYWRAWVEVKAAGEWIALDPELGQAVADATHVKLSIGEWNTEAVSLFGAVEVLSVRTE